VVIEATVRNSTKGESGGHEVEGGRGMGGRGEIGEEVGRVEVGGEERRKRDERGTKEGRKRDGRGTDQGRKVDDE
jgi:hypothetical protein